MKRIMTVFSNKLLLTVSIFALFGMCIKPDIIRVSVIAVLALISMFWLFGKKDIELCGESSSPSLVASVLSCFIGIGFYNTWIMSSKLGFVAEKMGLSTSVLLLGVTVVAVLLAVPFAALAFNIIANRLSSAIKSEKSATAGQLRDTFKDIFALKKSVLILFGILIFAMLAIIRANFNYVDDMHRVVFGFSGWENFSRYVSNFLSPFIHGDSYLADVSPFPQIIALLIIAISGVFVVYIFTSKTKFGVWEYAAIIPMCISPYFLECLSYKYDSPYMALSVLFSVIPFLFRNLKFRYYSLISFISLMLMCMSYQASSGIYIVMVIFLAFRAWNTKEQHTKDVIKWVLVSAASFLCAMIVFKIINANFQEGNYRSVEMFSADEMVVGVLKNIFMYCKRIIQDIKSAWLILMGIICAGYPFAMCSVTKHKKIVSFTVAVFVFLVSVVLSLGAYLFLKEISIAPRSMYGVFVCISIAAVSGVLSNINISKAAGLILSVSFIIFSFTYGNALEIQKEYTDYRISMVAEELAELDCVQNEDSVYVQVKGTIGYARAINNIPNQAMIKRLVPVTFCENWIFGHSGLAYYYGLNNLKIDLETDYTQFNLTTVCENGYYKIEVYNEYVLITLK